MATELVQALLTTYRALQECGVPSAMMGGLAVAAWNRRRATDDIDLLISASIADSDSILRHLQKRGFHPRRIPPVTDFDGEHVMQLKYEMPGKSYGYDVDLFFAESGYHRAAFDRRDRFQLPDGEEVPVIACEDLILFKLSADRLIDRVDVIELLRLNRKCLDIEYIRHWLTAPEIRKLWSECWCEAFPGELDPIVTG